MVLLYSQVAYRSLSLMYVLPSEFHLKVGMHQLSVAVKQKLGTNVVER